MTPRHRARQRRPDENRNWFKSAATALLLIAKVVYDYLRDSDLGC